MPNFLPVRSAPHLDVASFKHVPVESQVRHSTEAESARDVRDPKKAVEDSPEDDHPGDDQFGVMFRMMISCAAAVPAAQTPGSLSFPSDETATDGSDGIPALAKRASGSGTPGVETPASSIAVADTSAATSSAAVSIPEITESVRHRSGETQAQHAGIQAIPQSLDAADLNAKLATTTLSETTLNASPSYHSTLTPDTNRSPATGAESVSMRVLPGAMKPAAGAAPLFETAPDPADLSDEMAAALERVGRPVAGDVERASPAELPLISTAPVSAATPSTDRKIHSLIYPTSSDVTSDVPNGISEQPAASDVHPANKKPVADDHPDESLPKSADHWQGEFVPSTQSAGAISTQELSAAISGELGQPLTHQVSQAVIDRLERGDITDAETLTIQLDPPELGELVIELSRTRDGLAVRVTARDAVTMDMLLARGSEIESQLRSKELDLTTLEFLPSNMTGGDDFERQQSPSARQPEHLQAVRKSARRTIGETGTVANSRSLSAESRQALSFRA